MRPELRPILLLLLPALFATSPPRADDGGWTPRHTRDEAAPDVAAVTNPEYRSVCGACHLAYPPGFLPARSWRQITTLLPWHFGRELDLDAGKLERLQRYLELAAADRSGHVRSIKIMISIPTAEAPLRISELSHVRVEHAKAQAPIDAAAAKVGGLHRCEGCHTRAESGYFNEDEVVMPLIGETTPPASTIEAGTH